MRALLRTAYRAVIHVVRALIVAADRMIGRRQFIKACHFMQERLDLTLDVEGIRFWCATPLPFLRANTLMSKEPETIAWIDAHFRSGDVFYDIGANVGVFSLYAAKKMNCRVLAFEPESNNYATLNRNIWLNGLDESILAFNLALHDKARIDVLNLSKFTPGGAVHSFANTIDGWGRAFKPVFRQGVIGVSIDDLIAVYEQPFPTHIKIDVDGNEHIIVAGMSKTLADPRLKSIAIELNLRDREEIDRSISETILSHGFEPLSGDRFVNPVKKDMKNYFFLRP